MAEALICETCGKVARSDRAPRWLKVTAHVDVLVYEFGGTVIPSPAPAGDFCSSACLAKTAAERAAFEAARDAEVQETVAAHARG